MDQIKQPNFGDLTAIMLDEVNSLTNVMQKQMLHAPLQRYPEDKFFKYFLPYFLGLAPVPPDQNLYTVWAAETGSIHSEVEIYDVNNPSVTLFVVPPLMNTDGIDLANAPNKHIRFNHLHVEYENEARNFPQIASQNYYAGIGHKLMSTFAINKQVPDALNKWIAIYQYYNIPLPGQEQQNGNQPVQTQQSVSPNNGWGNVGELDFNPSFD